MSFDSLLIHTCTIKRFNEGAKDDYGIPVKTWTNLLVDEPCRHTSGNGREIKVGQEVLIVYDELFLNDVDVTVQDRVEIDGELWEILDVRLRSDFLGGHHKECSIQVVR
jgi:hypothetical protein